MVYYRYIVDITTQVQRESTKTIVKAKQNMQSTLGYRFKQIGYGVHVLTVSLTGNYGVVCLSLRHICLPLVWVGGVFVISNNSIHYFQQTNSLCRLSAM